MRLIYFISPPKLIIGLFALLFTTQAFTQDLTNKGATITIKNGTELYLPGNLLDSSGATAKWSNSGKIYLKGDLKVKTKNTFFTTDQFGNVRGTLIFHSDTNIQNIYGDTLLKFHNLLINNNSIVNLDTHITVDGRLNLKNGKFSINDNIVDLGTNGKLVNETVNNRVYANTGLIRLRRTLTTPAFSDSIGGIGFFISASGHSFGSTLVERGEVIQTSAGDGSIKRFFNFYPTFPGTVDSIKLNYFDPYNLSEKNEENLKIWYSKDTGIVYRNLKGRVDSNNNFVVTDTPITLGNSRLTISDEKCDFPPVLRLPEFTQICDGDSVVLNADNTGAEFLWSTGETSQKITVKNSGIYTVLVTNIQGCFTRDTAEVVIRPNPVASFTYNTNKYYCLYDSVHFSNNSTVSEGSLSYLWDFNTGNYDTLLSPATSFPVAGTFKIRLYATSSFGCKDTTTGTVEINPVPEAKFTSPDVCQGDSVSFINKSSLSTGSINYSWEFGDGTYSNSVNPKKYYLNDSVFTPQLIATSFKGCTDTFSRQVEIYPFAKASFTANSACENDTVHFNNGSNVATGNLSYQWIFGDGRTSGQKSPSLSYSADGSYQVKLIATSDKGCVDSFSNQLTIYNRISPSFTVSDNCLNDSTIIKNTTIFSGSPAFSWSLGDGNSNNGINSRHLYNAPGTYAIKLIATTSNGCKDSATGQVEVYHRGTPSFTMNDTCHGKTTYFRNNSGISNGILSYKWYFGDGTTSVSGNPTKTYGNTGAYTVKLLITSNKGCTDSLIKNVKVYPVPKAGFVANNVCMVDSVNFINTSTISSGNISYFWKLGDGNNSTIKDPNHLYSSATTFSPSLKVVSGFGCSDSITKSIRIHPIPSAGFSVNNICKGNTASFINTSSVSGSTFSSKWYFGNGTTSVKKNPAEIFKKSGTYNVKLVVISNEGCKDSITKILTVNPLPVLDMGDTISTCGTSIELDAKNTGASFLWSTNEKTQKITVTNTGTYSVTISDKNNCQGGDTVFVRLKGDVIPNLGKDRSVCNQTDLDAGYPGSTYLWSTGGTGRYLRVTQSGIYSVIVTDANGCTGYDTVEITVNPLPEVDLGPDIAVCKGTSVSLDAGNTGSSFLWSNNLTTQTIPVSKKGTYWVRVTDNKGCKNKDTVQVAFFDLPAVDLGNDLSVCNYTPVNLNAGLTATRYLWSEGSKTRSIPVTSTGKYWVEVENADGCISSDTINITINPSPVVNLGPDTFLCSDKTITLDAGNPGGNYNWSTGKKSQTITPTKSGTYHVEVTNSYGCKGNDTIYVRYFEMPLIPFGPDKSVCGIATLNAKNPGASYLWSTGEVSQSITVTRTDSYSVKITTPNNCQVTDTIVVTVNPTPVIDLGSDTMICEGGNIILDAGNPDKTFLWNTGSVQQTLNIAATGEYWVVVTGNTGCKGRDTFNLKVNPNPRVNLGKDDILCGNEEIILFAGKPGSTVVWESDFGSYAGGYSFKVDTTGKYWVTVTDPFGCRSSDTVLFEPTEFSVDAQFLAASLVDEGDTIQFINLSFPGQLSYFWDFGDGNNSIFESPIHSFSDDSTYSVTLIASNGICTDTAIKSIIVRPLREEIIDRPNDLMVRILNTNLYPNPTPDKFTVQVELNRKSDIGLTLFSMNGQMLKRRIIRNSDEYSGEFSTDDWPKGIYILHIAVRDMQKTFKIIKQ